MSSQQQIQQQENLVSLVKVASSKLQMNSLGLPEGIYRPDLLPVILTQENGNANTKGKKSKRNLPVNYDESLEPKSKSKSKSKAKLESESESDSWGSDKGKDKTKASDIDLSLYLGVDEYKHALIPLSYAEGFPTMEDGQPFWSQFDFEPTAEFKAFQAYLHQGKQGARQLFKLSEPDSTNPDAVIILTKKQLQQAFILYYWEWRTKAFDLYYAASLSKARQHRALEVEDTHFILSERLLRQIMLYMEPDEDGKCEFMDLMTPKTAVDVLKLVTQLQRVSSGLPAQGPLPSGDGVNAPQGASIEVVMRNIVKQAGKSEEARITVNDTTIFQEALENEDTAALAQELVFKMNGVILNGK